MLGVLRGRALAEVGPYGLNGVSSGPGSGTFGGVDQVAGPGLAAPTVVNGAASGTGAVSSATAGAAAPSASPSSPSLGYSTTNDQEQGVDEPDLAKTDGSLLVALRQIPPGIEVATVGTSPTLHGFAALPDMSNPVGLFLVGSDAVVIGQTQSSVGVPEPLPQSSAAAGTGAVTSPAPVQAPSTVVTVVNVSDPDHPSVSRSFTIQGSEVDARLVSGTVEVVVQSSPTMSFVSPADGSASSTAAATSMNTAIVNAAPVAAFLPTVTNTTTGTTTTPPCTDAMYQTSSTGDSTVAVVPIDPNANQPGPEATVVGNASSVYASTGTLYVASTQWPTSTGSSDAQVNPSTEVSAFDLSDPSHPSFVGSGTVEGSLIGQYAMSEYQGYLRVATTVGEPSPAPVDGAAPTVLSDNRVTVLQASNGALGQVGSIGGLGAGEKIYAVRFIGALGYVVTFNQTDPLYIVDLTDPHNPALAAQLPLTGYSSFLEPLSNGELLGIGQSVDQSYRTQGLQVSLFDVSDPAHPALLDKLVYAGGSSSAQQDPHALLYWPATNDVIMPFEGPSSSPDSASGSSSTGGATGGTYSLQIGALALSVANGSVSPAGFVTAPAATPQPVPLPPGVYGSAGVSGGVASAPASGVMIPAGSYIPVDPMASGIERNIVVGTMLYSVTDEGIVVSDLATFHQLDWLAYPPAS